MTKEYPPNNTKTNLTKLLSSLQDDGLNIVLFGGWAAEFQGLESARKHSDIDLLFVDESFAPLTQVALMRDWPEPCKSYSHKKAFVLNDVLVEFFLVNKGVTAFISKTQPTYYFQWSDPLFNEVPVDSKMFKMATKEAMEKYRHEHKAIHANSDWV